MKKTTGPHDHSTTAALCGCHVALGLLGLSWTDGDGMGGPSPQPSDNLDQVPASILEPEAPPEASKISLQAAEQRPETLRPAARLAISWLAGRRTGSTGSTACPRRLGGATRGGYRVRPPAR